MQRRAKKQRAEGDYGQSNGIVSASTTLTVRAYIIELIEQPTCCLLVLPDGIGWRRNIKFEPFPGPLNGSPYGYG